MPQALQVRGEGPLCAELLEMRKAYLVLPDAGCNLVVHQVRVLKVHGFLLTQGGLLDCGEQQLVSSSIAGNRASRSAFVQMPTVLVPAGSLVQYRLDTSPPPCGCRMCGVETAAAREHLGGGQRATMLGGGRYRKRGATSLRGNGATRPACGAASCAGGGGSLPFARLLHPLVLVLVPFP